MLLLLSSSLPTHSQERRRPQRTRHRARGDDRRPVAKRVWRARDQPVCSELRTQLMRLQPGGPLIGRSVPSSPLAVASDINFSILQKRRPEADVGTLMSQVVCHW